MTNKNNHTERNVFICLLLIFIIAGATLYSANIIDRNKEANKLLTPTASEPIYIEFSLDELLSYFNDDTAKNYINHFICTRGFVMDIYGENNNYIMLHPFTKELIYETAYIYLNEQIKEEVLSAVNIGDNIVVYGEVINVGKGDFGYYEIELHNFEIIQ